MHITSEGEGEATLNQQRNEEDDPFTSNWGEWEQRTASDKSPSKQTQLLSLSPSDSREATPITKMTSLRSRGGGGGGPIEALGGDIPNTSLSGNDKSTEAKQPLATSTPSRSTTQSGKSQVCVYKL